MRILAVITARENSRRCRKKNLRKIGKSSITKIAVDKARELKKKGVVTDYVLSTDSVELLAECFYPDMLSVKPRKESLSGDSVKSVDVIIDLLETLSNQEKEYDAVIILQPTSPLASVYHIEKAVRKFVVSDADSLISACKLENVSINGLYLEKDGDFCPISENHNSGTRKQELPVLYLRNGAVYITKVSYIDSRNLLISEKPEVYVMPEEESVDIDNEADFNKAKELYLKKYPVREYENSNLTVMSETDSDHPDHYCLSICIPTYDRPNVLKKCLDNLLEWIDKTIEVVIVDDHSSVNIEEYIKAVYLGENRQVGDQINFYRNEENMGASYNSYISFMKAKGDYVLLMSDEDDLNRNVVNRIMQRLKDDSEIVGCFMSGRRGKNEIKHFDDREYENAFLFLKELGFSTRYMTGVMFRRESVIKSVGIVSSRDAQKIFNVYSFMVIAAFISFEGKIITSSEEAYIQNRFTETTMNTNPKNAPDIFYFEPEGRKLQIQSWVYDISVMNLNLNQKIVLLIKIYNDACKVSSRIFDEEQQKQYQRMIPQYYELFLEHIKEDTLSKVSEEMWHTMADSAEKCGIISISELQRVIGRYEC